MGVRQGVLRGFEAPQEAAADPGAASGTRRSLRPAGRPVVAELAAADRVAAELAGWTASGRPTIRRQTGPARGSQAAIPTWVNEFWTSRQRAASSLHEISYRACFKPALPRFFIERFSAPGEIVHDPFLGRGTTALEAALLGRVPCGSDVNPLSRMLLEPRLSPPRQDEVADRLAGIDLHVDLPCDPELLVFYHPDTLRELTALRDWLLRREVRGELDGVDRWIRMVAVNRLTGHSPGFFSVYTLPPNQAVTVASQRRINERRAQSPPRRDVPALLLRKSRALLASVDDRLRAQLALVAARARIACAPAAATPQIESDSVALVVTSPPFLDVVQYATDNWLRCWFCGVDAGEVALTQAKRIDVWEAEMTAALRELRRVLRPGGHVAFEVGEVRGGRVELERNVVSCAIDVGLEPRWVLVQDQQFTKTANCWGVGNNQVGTNTNRVVLLRRPSMP